MAAKQDKRQRLYSTEEVLAYLHIDSTSDETTSEESEDDWQSSDSDSADRPGAKRPKLTTSTLAQDVQLSQQQTTSKCGVYTPMEGISTDEHVTISEPESFEAEWESNTESSDKSGDDVDEDEDGDEELDSFIEDGETGKIDGEQGSVDDEQGDVDGEQGDVDGEQGNVDGEQGNVDGEQGEVDSEESEEEVDGEQGDDDSDFSLIDDRSSGCGSRGGRGGSSSGRGSRGGRGGSSSGRGSRGRGGSSSGRGSRGRGGSNSGHGSRGSSSGRGSRGRGGSSSGHGSRGRGGSNSGHGSRGGHGGSSSGRGRRGRRSGSSSGTSVQRSSQGVEGVPEGSQAISQVDSDYEETDAFNPLRVPGPHLPESVGDNPSELDLFQLFIDEGVLERLVTSTNEYAEKNRNNKPIMYKRFKHHPLTPDEMMRYLGCLLLLSINSVRNYCLALSKKSSQHLSHLHRLMSRDRFEAIGAFLHAVTGEEESSMSTHKLKKILPLHDVIKKKCLDLYQPLQQLSVDERMVKSKARTQFRQYIRNKPTKWGFKYWVLADPTGYTVDFNIYCGSTSEESSGQGLGYDVVTKLTTPFQFQGYQLHCDNFYSSTTLFSDLLENGITATGTVRTNRVGVPKEVKVLKEALEKSRVPRGTGYYFRPKESKIAYIVWKDSKCVTVMTTAFPGHSTSTVRCRVKSISTGVSHTEDVPILIAVEKYNAYMGGVDKSNQFISYNRVLRKTVRYWKTFLYHLLEIVATNSSILFNWRRMESQQKRLSQTQFLDRLVQQIIEKYGKRTPDTDDYTIMHGSQFRTGKIRKCAYCHTGRTFRFCPDCSYEPSLCQLPERDCHSIWHQQATSRTRKHWMRNQARGHSNKQTPDVTAPKQGRPAGSTNLKKRRGQYKRR